MTFPWTNEKESELRSLWQKGYSARQIADMMGGVSRNAVIGKAHRLGLSQRIAPPKREYIHVHFERERHCQWPFGDPLDSDFHLCGRDVVHNKPYCKEHCANAYRRLSVLEADREFNRIGSLIKKI
ncbi:MAG: GcrA family cell cycle regulator [Alphaproteobacteria bacterium]